MQRRESYMMGTTPPTLSASMPAMVGKKVWTSQPQVPVGIARSNPFGARVIDSLVGNQTITSLGKPVTKYGTVSSGAYQGGYGYKTSGAGGFGFPCDLSAHSEITIVFEYIHPAIPTTAVIFEHSANQNTNAGSFILYAEPTSGGSLQFSTSNGAGGYDACSCALPDTTKTTKIALRLRFSADNTGTDVGIAVNGVVQTKTFIAGSTTVRNFGNFQTYFFARGGSSLYADATFGGYAVLKGFATDSELANLSANPWQIFAPMPKQVWVPA